MEFNSSLSSEVVRNAPSGLGGMSVGLFPTGHDSLRDAEEKEEVGLWNLEGEGRDNCRINIKGWKKKKWIHTFQHSYGYIGW